jgi:spermidine/putrescine transport system permease protein
MSENRFAHLVLAPPGLWLLLLFAVPFGIVIAVSLGAVDPLYQAVYGWNPGNYADVFDPTFLPVLLRSVGYAFATVVICILIGYPISYYIARYGGKWKTLLIAVVVLPFLVNYLVRTYAWVAILSDEGLLNGILKDIGFTENGIQFVNSSPAVIGGLVYGYLAFMVLPLYAALDRMDPSLIEAGKDLYGTKWQTFRHVTWPAAFQGVAAGCVLVFLPAVGDFIAAQLLGGPNTYMIGNLIQQQFLENQNWPFGASLTIVLMGFLLIFMFAYLRSALRQSREPAL